jgi:hypothetical protein
MRPGYPREVSEIPIQKTVAEVVRLWTKLIESCFLELHPNSYEFGYE